MRWPKLWMVSGKFFPTYIHKVEISAKLLALDTYLTLVIGGNCKPGNVLSRPRLGPLGFALGRRPRSPIPEAAPWVTLAPTIVMAKREYKSWLHSFQTPGFWQKPMAQMWPWNIWNETCNFLKPKKKITQRVRLFTLRLKKTTGRTIICQVRWTKYHCTKGPQPQCHEVDALHILKSISTVERSLQPVWCYRNCYLSAGSPQTIQARFHLALSRPSAGLEVWTTYKLHEASAHIQKRQLLQRATAV